MKKSKKLTLEAYRVLMDWWILPFVAFLLVFLVIAIPALPFAGVTGLPHVVASVIIVLTTLYVVDTAFFTYYQLGENELVISSQLRRHAFPYRLMREVRPIGLRGLFSIGSRKRFAASMKAYQITLSGHHWKTITVSPVERDMFINNLMEHVDRERSKRATTSRIPA